jgi:hypothetical protein
MNRTATRASAPPAILGDANPHRHGRKAALRSPSESPVLAMPAGSRRHFKLIFSICIREDVQVLPKDPGWTVEANSLAAGFECRIVMGDATRERAFSSVAE